MHSLLRNIYIYISTVLAALRARWAVLAVIVLTALIAVGQYNVSAFGSGSELPPPPAVLDPTPLAQDATAPPAPPTLFPVSQTIPVDYEALVDSEFAADLASPSNLKTVAEYDPSTGCYIVRTRLGDYDITTPIIMSPQQYNNWQGTINKQM